MRITKAAAAVSLAAGLTAATPATAGILHFDIAGSFTSSFSIDTTRTPDRVNSQLGGLLTQILYDNRSVLFNGVERVATISFGSGLAADFQLFGPGIPFTQLIGPTVFSGPLTAPMFALGDFQFRNPFFGQSVTLSIRPVADAVPAPSTMPALMAGLAALGALAARRRATR